MTSNQIEYWKLQELKRANLINEEQARAILEENKRHNSASEATDRQRVLATYQANLLQATANAEIRRANIARETETARSNRAREVETYRSNYAREIETARTNAANEALKAQQIAATVWAAQQNAESARYSANAGMRNAQVAAAASVAAAITAAKANVTTAQLNGRVNLERIRTESNDRQKQLNAGFLNNYGNIGLRRAELNESARRTNLNTATSVLNSAAHFGGNVLKLFTGGKVK